MRRTEEAIAIWEAQGKCCAICGVPMVPSHMHHPTRGWTFDHVFNHASRRYFADGNKLIAHSECNNIKADGEPSPEQVALLHEVNAKLGLELTERTHAYSDPKGPSALAIALEQAMAA